MELQELRNEIDAIDKELVRLFCRRMDTVRAVAEYKKAHAVAVLDSSREEQVLDRVSGGECTYPDETRELYRSIMEISKKYQRRLNGGE